MCSAMIIPHGHSAHSVTKVLYKSVQVDPCAVGDADPCKMNNAYASNLHFINDTGSTDLAHGIVCMLQGVCNTNLYVFVYITCTVYTAHALLYQNTI